MIDIKIKRTQEASDLELSYKHNGDAGFDIRAAKDILVGPKQIVAIPIGIMFEIPKGYVLDVRPRSGLSLNTRLRVSNSPGTIDSGYPLEVSVIIENTSDVPLEVDQKTFKVFHNYTAAETHYLDVKGAPHGNYMIKKGDRIAQMVLMKHETANIIEVDNELNEGTDRTGGFGSTKVK